MQDQPANLASIVANADSGVTAGAELIAFAEAVVAGDRDTIATARDTVAAELGVPAMVDAAAVIANFQRMVRIADSTGIPLDEPVLMMTQGIRDELGLNQFSAAANSPRLPLLKRLAGKLLAPIAPRILRRMARKRSSR